MMTLILITSLIILFILILLFLIIIILSLKFILLLTQLSFISLIILQIHFLLFAVFIMNIYRVDFTIEINCNGVISYASAHTSILADSKEEAINKVKNNVNFTYTNTLNVDLII